MENGGDYRRYILYQLNLLATRGATEFIILDSASDQFLVDLPFQGSGMTWHYVLYLGWMCSGLDVLRLGCLVGLHWTV